MHCVFVVDGQPCIRPLPRTVCWNASSAVRGMLLYLTMHSSLQDQADDYLDHALLLSSTSGACMTMQHGCKWPTWQAAKSNAS